jgi:inner membrane protein
MATVISHSVAALAVGKAFAPPAMPPKFWILTAICAALPDVDVITFSFNIRYGDMLGHRGLTHSFPFAVILCLLIVWLFFQEAIAGSLAWFTLLLYFFVVTASHGLLDALTNGGLGVAFFAPFNSNRYFFPWRPIEVSPIGIQPFFSARGAAVLFSELRWIWIPSAVLIAVAGVCRRAFGQDWP